MTAIRTCLFGLAAATQVAAATVVHAQAGERLASPDRSTAQLRRSLDGLTTTARVLIVGMHPDDELPQLSSWLSLGRHVETAYLSVTRGESGEDFNGTESGVSLGVVRVGEALQSRRIDGAHQYFTRAYDFGAVRSADEVFQKAINDSTFVGTWDRDSIVGDVVTVIRAFRPQVIIAVIGDTVATGSGQHRAMIALMNAAFGAATDSMRFGVTAFGAPWPAAKLYRVGKGIRINTGELDRSSGRTYASIGRDVQAQQRSQGPAVLSRVLGDTIELEMIASRVNRGVPDSALFAGVDTSFARLSGESPELSTIARRIASLADSLRPVLDVTHPDAAVPPLAELARLASAFRRSGRSCAHASSLASVSVTSARSGHVCDAGQLDRDAAADLMRDRANAALLTAAGVEITATADRELLARFDTAKVTVKIANRGATPVRLAALSVHRAVEDTLSKPLIQPGSTLELVRGVERLPSIDVWWSGKRVGERYPDTLWPRDGLNRGGAAPESSLAPAEAVPEELRRATDVSVFLEIAGAEVATTIGPVLYRHADAFIGVQNRPLSGVPEVTIRFARNLEWLPLSKPVSRVMRVKVQSYSDHPLVLGIGKAAEAGIIVDGIPKEVKLEPREQRELLLPIRGRISDQRRQQFLVWAVTPQIVTYQMAYQPVVRDYLEPARMPRATGAFLQGVNVNVPSNLTVYYVPEGVDDIRSTLSQIGITARELATDVLLTADLSHVSTIVLAPRAVERFPELGAQANRLMDFVRAGGTLIVQRGGDTTLASRLLPFPVSFAKPAAEAVLDAGAPVKAIDPQARVLNWPNKITDKDWLTWPLGRAESIPTTADPRYQRVVETHDKDQAENSNGILIAHVGKGTLIYTSLTFDQQIAGASTGALRLFVNLLSAGLPR